MGDSAKAVDGNFEIVGEGKVIQRSLVDGKEKDITYTRALHTPSLNANLISISAFDKAGLTTTFGGGRGVIRKVDGTVVLTARLEKGMYLVDGSTTGDQNPIALRSLSRSTSLEQWHRRLTHCSPSTILEMVTGSLVDGLSLTDKDLQGRCEDCVLGHQTRRPFDGATETNLEPLELVSFDLWGPSRTQSGGGKIYFMPIVDAGTSYKHGAYLSDKSDLSTISAFDAFRVKGESMTGKKIRRLRTDRAYESEAWEKYCTDHGIIHEFTAPYSSAQNGLAERAIRTTMDDVRTLLSDSGLGHSFWAEAAAYSVDTRNLIPSRRHPGKIPLELFSGKRQNISHLRAFGSKCWAKIPTIHGVQVTGGSKLDQRGVECRFLGYAGGGGNYKVQDVLSRRVFVSRDVIFEEGDPHRTSPGVGENGIPLFDTGLDDEEPSVEPPANNEDTTKTPINTHSNNGNDNPDLGGDPDIDGEHRDIPTDNVLTNSGPQIPIHADQQVPIPRRSARIPQPSNAILRSKEYQQRESTERHEGREWATNQHQASAVVDWVTVDQENYTACLAETKASHHIPSSYRHAMATDPERWKIPMKIEMETLKAKHTWDLVKPPPGANIIDVGLRYQVGW